MNKNMQIEQIKTCGNCSSQKVFCTYCGHRFEKNEDFFCSNGKYFSSHFCNENCHNHMMFWLEREFERKPKEKFPTLKKTKMLIKNIKKGDKK